MPSSTQRSIGGLFLLQPLTRGYEPKSSDARRSDTWLSFDSKVIRCNDAIVCHHLHCLFDRRFKSPSKIVVASTVNPSSKTMIVVGARTQKLFLVSHSCCEVNLPLLECFGKINLRASSYFKKVSSQNVTYVSCFLLSTRSCKPDTST